jgi:hypothetical protein
MLRGCCQFPRRTLSCELGERFASQESERLSPNIHEGQVPNGDNPEVTNLILDQYRERPCGKRQVMCTGLAALGCWQRFRASSWSITQAAVRHFLPTYLRGDHGPRHDAWHAQCDLDPWSCPRPRLAPARSIQPLGCAYFGYCQPIGIYVRAGKKRSVGRAMPLWRRSLWRSGWLPRG